MTVASAQRRVPIPKPVRRPQRKWPWAEMKVGEMFFSPNHATNTMTTLAWSTGKKLGRKFTTRLVWMRKAGGDGDEWLTCDEGHRRAVQGIAVWRIK